MGREWRNGNEEEEDVKWNEWTSCSSSHKDSLIRSSQLCRGRTVRVELATSTATQLPPSILVPPWSENRTLHQNVSLARSWLFLAVRAGEHNLSTHHHHHRQRQKEVKWSPTCALWYNGLASHPIMTWKPWSIYCWCWVFTSLQCITVLRKCKKLSKNIYTSCT